MSYINDDNDDDDLIDRNDCAVNIILVNDRCNNIF